MAKYRKKPVVIEAVQFNGFEWVDEACTPMFDYSFVGPEWLTEAMAKSPNSEGSIDNDGEDLFILTLEGEHKAQPGDYIIRGVKGEIYPCKPDIFAVTYEAAE